MLRENVLKTIKENQLIEDGDKIVLGVSGGPDSIAMLHILNHIKKQEKIKFDMVVAHINHGVRENARYDEEYVLAFCEKIDLKCFVLHADVKQLAIERKRGIEETGRSVRYDFFEQVRKEINANKIAIAHNNNDSVETMFMHMMRGSGLHGLRGIVCKKGRYIRPLIHIKREEIEAYCEQHGLCPRHDESNDDNCYTRNKIRNIVIPYIKQEFNPNIIDTMSRLSEIIGEEIAYLDSQVEKAYQDICVEENLVIKENSEIDRESYYIADKGVTKDKNDNQSIDQQKVCRNISHEKNISKENVYNKENESTIILDLKRFQKEERMIQKRIILYAIDKLFGTTKGIEKIHIDDIIKLCNNNIGNKFLTPNKRTKIVIQNKKIYIIAVK